VAVCGIASCAVCVPLNPAAPPFELGQSLSQTRAKALLVAASTPAALKNLAHRAGIKLLEYSIDESGPIGNFCIEGNGVGNAPRSGLASNEEPALVMRTSGTTAQAKIVPLSHDTIVAQAMKLHRVFDLSAADRCLNAMPLCYAHGLVTGTLMPLVIGGAVIEPSTFDAEMFFACMREFLPTWYTATPPYHQAILDWLEQQPDALAGHRLRFIRSGSGALPPRLGHAVEVILGVPLLESYASTEPGVISCNPPSGLRKAGTVGRSPDNDIAIMHSDGRLVAQGMAGEVVVSGASVFGGYEADHAANERAFRDGWYRTGDHGVIDADGYLKVLGRLDDMINRGGEKISPREVDDALLDHEAVVDAVAFAVPHPTLNQELAAAVVLRPGAQISGDELRQSLAARFVPAKVPRIILCVPQLPKGPSGKIQRNKLAEYFSDELELTPSAESEPLSKIEGLLLPMWRNVLKRQDIDVEDDFFLFGGDSLSALDLLHRIEQKLQGPLPITLLFEAPTVRQLAARLEKPRPTDGVIRIHSTGARPPLFTITASPLELLRLTRALSADQPCYCIQPPDKGWSSAGTLPQMAARCISQIQAIQPRGPYRLLGSSFGGLIAFEMALQLQTMGESVKFLGMVDTALPICIVDGKRRTGASLELLSAQPVRDFVYPAPLIAAAHANPGLHYILDNRSPQSIFRGELTFFYCMGTPILLEGDARRSWKYFAEKYRLLPLPGPHGEAHLDPQLTALQNLTSACLDGTPPKGCDPASVFERFFRIEQSNDRETILDAAGEVYRVRTSGQQGCLECVWSSNTGLRLEGWAVEPERQEPAQMIVVFLDGQSLGYGASGVARLDVARYLGAPTARYAGFRFDFRDRILDHSGGLLQRLFLLTTISGKRLRLFVLSRDGSAMELQYRRAIQFRRIVGRALGNWPRLAQVAARLVPRTDRFVFGPRRHN
jgi:oxalate---CoA ligase